MGFVFVVSQRFVARDGYQGRRDSAQADSAQPARC